MPSIPKSVMKKKRPKTPKLAERITWTGTIIGLIVDLIAIAQIIANALRGNVGFSYLNVFISPTTGFVIWGLAFFTYVAFLHLYWENNIDENGFSLKFSWFIVNDLILEFRKPFLLLPFIIWIIIGFPLLSLVSVLLPSCFGTILMIGIMILIVAKIMNLRSNDFKTDIMGRVTERTKHEIDNDWVFLENRIKVELERKIFVRYSDFTDLEETRSYDMQTFWYILALYASKNSGTAKFGALWKVKGNDGKPSLMDVNVLVDLRNFLSSDYYVS